MSKEIEWRQSFEVFQNEDEFLEEDRKLISEAKNATALAYAPYSGFHVGVALLLADGSIVLGANQENAAYPQGSCAEKVAFFKAATSGKIQNAVKLAVVAMKDGKLMPASPCGGCRQVMLEKELVQKGDIQLIMMADEGQWVKVGNIKSLLPFSFRL